MKDVTGLVVVFLALLVGRAGGMEPSSGYCIGNECFTVFQDHSDYRSAQSQCEDQGGHLMTVRSLVSHEILQILLGNFTGRFWIGLHMAGAACPDTGAMLKGFEWVTKDTRSDFDNWAPSFDDSCSAPRCISVSLEDDFKWTQEPCHQRTTGFLCEYSFNEPCKSLAVAAGESVTYKTSFGFGGKDLLSLPPGSTAIRMPGEAKYVCFMQQWLQAPWACEIQEGGCEYKCAVDPNKMPSCYCPPGQSVSPANKVTCEVAIADPCLALRCQHACYKDGDSYACICDHGFKLAQDGRSCVDFNDCTDERQCPGENFMCMNTVGGFECVCKDGFKMSGGLCVDVEECLSAPCEHICTNTPGSYSCSCYDGYKTDPKEPNRCKLHCGEEECVAECDPNDRYQCYCPDGYVIEERTVEAVCIDIDECAFYYCDQGCENTFGSYVCSCAPGYTLVEQYKCVGNEDDMVPTDAATTPKSVATSAVPYPDPTRQPSAVSVGGFVGIIVCTVFFIVLAVCVAHYILCGRGKMESSSALKTSEDEAHGLQHVSSDA